MFVWVSFLFILLVHWLMGKLLARLAMFAAMMVIVSLYVPHDTFMPAGLFLGGLFSWIVSGIPYRYRRRQDKKLAMGWSALDSAQLAGLRPVARETAW